jgi:hypothetical protein
VTYRHGGISGRSRWPWIGHLDISAMTLARWLRPAVRVNSMSPLSFVRELVKELMEADADEEERLKGKLKMRKILKTRKYPDADGEEHRKRMRKILNTRKYPDEDDDDPD